MWRSVFSSILTQLTLLWLLLFYAGFLLVVCVGDAQTTAWMRQTAWIEDLRWFWQAVSRYGMYPFYLLFLALLGWAWWNRRHDVRTVALGYLLAQLIGSILLVRTLKISLGRARPYAGEMPGIGTEWSSFAGLSGFDSFPSGHTADLLTGAIFIALLARNAWVTLAALAAALGMAFARVAVGDHYLSDVTAAWFIGGLTSLAVARWWVLPRCARFGQR
jgi:undecaprenyl-diphosphatase